VDVGNNTSSRSNTYTGGGGDNREGGANIYIADAPGYFEDAQINSAATTTEKKTNNHHNNANDQ
jgi:hypothetical protein